MPQSLHTGQVPVVTDASDASPGITTALTFVFGVPGKITHVGFYATATLSSGTYTAGVWQATHDDEGGGGTGTLLASKVYADTVVPSQMNWIELDDPVIVTPLTVAYRCGVHNNQGRYVATNNAFSTPPGIVNGDIHAPHSGDDPVGLGSLHNGTFNIDSAIGYPRQVGAAADYFNDVIFVADSEGGEEEHDTTGTAALTVTATAARSTSRFATRTAALTATAAATRSTARLTSGSAAVSLAASATRSTGRSTSARAVVAAGARATLSTVRASSGRAVLLLSAYSVSVRGGGGPRLVTVSRGQRLTTAARPSSITTTTRG
jgi:hypothetical protein